MIILRCKLCGKWFRAWFDWLAFFATWKPVHFIDKLYCDHCARIWSGTEV